MRAPVIVQHFLVLALLAWAEQDGVQLADNAHLELVVLVVLLPLNTRLWGSQG